MPTPIWMMPKDWNPNVAEGREARRLGLLMVHPYGGSAAGKEWEQGWKAEDAISNVEIVAPVVKATVVEVTPAREEVGAVATMLWTASDGPARRGRLPVTGNFATRAELESAIIARREHDPKTIASEVGVSLPLVIKIMIEKGVMEKPVSKGRRGARPMTGRFTTREELEAAIVARHEQDPKIIASEVGVSLSLVMKIMTEKGAMEKPVSKGRGAPLATGRFATRAELEAAILDRRDDDAKEVAAEVGVSFSTVRKIIANHTL